MRHQACYSKWKGGMSSFVIDLTGTAKIAEKQRDAEDASKKHKHLEVITFSSVMSSCEEQ